MDFRTLIIGLLIGWAVEWVIDWLYWRRRSAGSAVAAAELREQHGRLRAELDAANASANQFRAEVGKLNGSLSTAQAELDRLRAELATSQKIHASADAGWEQAVGARHRTQTLTIDAREGLLASAPADLSADLAGANATIERLRAELAALSSQHRRDALIEINGIGPVIEKRLFEAGIYTFEQVAQQTPERLRQLARLKDWQDADPDAWVAEARQRAQSQLSEG